MYIVIAAALLLGILSVFGRRLESARRQLGRLEAELHVLKHEMAHQNTETIKLHTKTSTVADDIEYTWEKYARKHLKKGWK
jgi:uncharacterized protein YoxC